MKINLYKEGSISDSLIKFVAIIVKYQDQWVLSRHKERSTWEFAGGHREDGESLHETAEVKLFNFIPKELTYPLIYPALIEAALEFESKNNKRHEWGSGLNAE